MPELRRSLRSCRCQRSRAIAVQSPTDVWLCCSESFQFAPPSAGSGFRSGQEQQQAQAQAPFAIQQRHRLFPVLPNRSEEHTSELQSLMRTSYAVFCLKKNITQTATKKTTRSDNILHLEILSTTKK